jgi:hypothetical protein
MTFFHDILLWVTKIALEATAFVSELDVSTAAMPNFPETDKNDFMESVIISPQLFSSTDRILMFCQDYRTAFKLHWTVFSKKYPDAIVTRFMSVGEILFASPALEFT